jgi:uncharacterized membrane protein YphA (DoxX/SURF4 family)
MFVRTVARPLLASWFIYAAVDAILDPSRHSAKTAPLVEPRLREAGVALTVPQLTRLHGIATLAAASNLAASRTPRTAGLALAGLAAVTAVVGEPFWREPAGPARTASRESFIKNISLLGGALIAASAGGPTRSSKARASKCRARKSTR